MSEKYTPGAVVFNTWTITQKIGGGSFGQVFEIQREDFGETYRAALKIITVPQSEDELRAAMAEGMTETQAERYFYSMVEEIVHEFAIMARLKGTANVVSYEDHSVVRHTDGIGWDILIRMELLNPLLPYAYKHPFSRREIIRLGIDLCKSLELCQKYNIIHRDIKPENIFVSDNGDFKLGDFGIARTIEKTTAGLSKKGTYNYMAPEVYLGNTYGFSVDIYSLGLVLYRLLNRNRVPFLPQAPAPITFPDRETALVKRMSGEAVPKPFYAEGRLAEIVLKACAFDSKDRYSSPAQMRQELEAILYDQMDAKLIYPDGDEVSLVENLYTSGAPKTQPLLPHAAPAATEKLATFKTAKLTTSKTEEMPHQPSPVLEDRQDEVWSPKAKSRLNMKILTAVVVVCIAVAVGVGLFLYNQRLQEEALAEAAANYLNLMEEGTALCDSDPLQAAERFLAAQGLCPDESAPYTSYAYALYCAQEYENCVTYIEDDLALGKNYDGEVQSKLSEILGAAYFELRDYAAAASFFRLSTAGGDITVSAMRDYAVSLGRLGDVEAADEVLQRMFDAGAENDITIYVQAEVDYALGNYLDAEKGFRVVLDTSKDTQLQKRAVRSLAEVYQDCSGLVRTSSSPIESPATKEVALLADGITKYGLRYDSTMWEMFALAYFESYHTDPSVTTDYLKKAAECFNRVIELGITKDYLYSNLYTVYYELGDYVAAEQALSDYEAAFPNDYTPHALRGVMLVTIENSKEQAIRDYSPAKSEYEQAGRMIRSSDDVTYYQQLGSLIAQLEEEGWI